MTDTRLIETAFPLRQVSLDSVHEKNVRHGHISTLHIWPARRPLAASRATLLAALLRDPGTEEGRHRLLGRMAGTVETVTGSNGEPAKETRGGILHWGRESEPEGAEEIARFRAEIREAFGGRVPRVLDPFAGGGAIPLEAMRLGCEAVAADLNPVAWFILRCTLHYPRLLAGRSRPLPAFAVSERAFVEAFLKARGVTGKLALRAELERLGHGDGEAAQLTAPALERDSPASNADFAWHLRAWGRRVLAGVRRELAGALSDLRGVRAVAAQGTAAERSAAGSALSAAAGAAARTGRGRARIHGRAQRGVRFALSGARRQPTLGGEAAGGVPLGAHGPLRELPGGDPAAQDALALPEGAQARAAHPGAAGGRRRGRLRDRAGRAGRRRHGAEARARPGARRRHDERERRHLSLLRRDRHDEGHPRRGAGGTPRRAHDGGRCRRAGRQGISPADRHRDRRSVHVERKELEALYADIPFGLPEESIVAERPSPNSRGASGLTRYGFDAWCSLFTDRQLLALGTFVLEIRRCAEDLGEHPLEWREALVAYLACSISRLVDRCCTLATWQNDSDKIGHAFARFALPMVWDFAESCPLADTTGGFIQAVEWIARVVEHAESAVAGVPAPRVEQQSATEPRSDRFDLVCTDPPYYDAIPYSDLMDFFHVWLRRTLHGLSPETDALFAEPLGPKWDADTNDGELVDQPSRFGTDGTKSRQAYEDGMFSTFCRCQDALRDDGRMIVVFANKQPAAWATLVSALIRAGFVVDASWPIQTERDSKVAGGARLSSSIWLVCRKRPATARHGWDNKVLAEMQANVTGRLRDFWDAGIRGPDFVWAATGPALEAFSRHPVVKKADAPGERLTVDEFLRRVRRMVVGFVVSRLLDQRDGATGELDDATTYYLLHRNDFRLDAAPAGACILYALSCNLSDADLAGRLDLLVRGGRAAPADDDEAGDSGRASGGEVRLKTWRHRHARDLGEPRADGRPAPLIDCVHRLMQLWRTGEQSRVDAWLEARGLWRHELFACVVQAIIELAERGSEERGTLESIQNHLRTHGGATVPRAMSLDYGAAP